MTIPVTVVGERGADDLLVPADVPLAVLAPQLVEVTGDPGASLRTAAGRALDPGLGLRANGVQGGALLVAAPPSGPRPRRDDLAHVAQEVAQAEGPPGSPDRAAVLVWLALPPLAVALAALCGPATLSVLCLAAILAHAALPRLVLRVLGFGADPPGSDLAVAGVRAAGAREETNDRALVARLASARAGLRRAGQICCLCAAAAAVALPAHGRWAALGGALVLTWLAARTFGRDGPSATAAVCATGLVVLLGLSNALPLPVAATGAVVAGLCLGNPERPVARVLRSIGERVTGIVAPVVLLLASGLLPTP